MERIDLNKKEAGELSPETVKKLQFKFAYDKLSMVNWRMLAEETQVEDIIRGDLNPLNGLMRGAAFSDLREDTYVDTSDPEVTKVMMAVQLGIQYLLHTAESTKRQAEGALHQLEAAKHRTIELKKYKKQQSKKIKLLKHQQVAIDESFNHTLKMAKEKKPDIYRKLKRIAMNKHLNVEDDPVSSREVLSSQKSKRSAQKSPHRKAPRGVMFS